MDFDHPRPLPAWLGHFRGVFFASMAMFVGGFLLAIAASAAHNASIALGGLACMFVGVLGLLTSSFMLTVWSTQQPIDGRVIERSFSVASFVPDGLPLNTTVEQMLDPDILTIQNIRGRRSVFYWLLIAPFNSGKQNRWVMVDPDVFGAHPVGTNFRAASPKPLSSDQPDTSNQAN
ncbi:MAG TPA: hypothetical protein VFT16_01365 [Candidatus Saccharimonadales bacterium]|nr:hypothetical protein [Candidatus Saccharimonadales bacterium]